MESFENLERSSDPPAIHYQGVDAVFGNNFRSCVEKQHDINGMAVSKGDVSRFPCIVGNCPSKGTGKVLSARPPAGTGSWWGDMNDWAGAAPSADMRLKDLRLTAELLVEAMMNEHGARDRVAERHRIRKSVITNRVDQVEQFFGVALFTGPQRKSPSAAGSLMAEYGPRLLDEIEHFGGRLYI